MSLCCQVLPATRSENDGQATRYSLVAARFRWTGEPLLQVYSPAVVVEPAPAWKRSSKATNQGGEPAPPAEQVLLYGVETLHPIFSTRGQG